MLVLVLLGLGAEPGPIVDLRHRWSDQLQRMAPRPYQDVGVRIVDIDEASLSRIGQWPWPRTGLAALTEALGAAGVAAIAFDVVFAEPDRHAPKRLLDAEPDWAADPAIAARIAALDDPDERFAAALSATPSVTGFFLTDGRGGRHGTGELPSRPFRIATKAAQDGAPPEQRLVALPETVRSLPALERAASGNGSLNALPDRDGIHRHIWTLFRTGADDAIVPSLSLEALRVAAGGRGYVLRSEATSRGLSEIGMPPAFTIPTDPRGRAWIHFTEPTTARTIPAWQVLDGSVGADALEGTIVFVGTSAVGLRDQRPTPLHPHLPGVELHAMFAEQVLLGHFVGRPDWALGAEWSALAALGIGLIALLTRASAFAGMALLCLAWAGAFGGSWLAFRHEGWLLDPVIVGGGALLVYLSASLLAHFDAETQRRRVRDAFGHYLAPAMVEALSADPDRLQLGGETRPLSLLFCDVRGFTTLSERTEPEALTRLVNRLLTPLSEAVLERGGTIDKYMGDCVMAFWNAPLAVDAHAARACDAALDMITRIDALNRVLAGEAERDGVPFEPLRVGVGVNTGPACVGNLGSDHRFDYSAIGDAVNLASRLEGQSKTYGVDIVIGEQTQREAPEFAALELDRIRVQGKLEPVRIFALVGSAERAQSAAFQELADAHAALRKRTLAQEWDAAAALADECARLAPDLEALYAKAGERIAALRETALPPDWDGVFVATSK